MAARHASAKTVTIRSGVDGERLRRAGHAARRRVADLLREAGVPRWERRWVPRIYCGEMLVAVVPLGVDAAFAAAAGEPGFSFEWQPEPWQAV